MSTQDCPRRGKWIGACQFEARYDRGAASPEALAIVGARYVDVEEILSLSRTKTYVHDVCVRCGKTIGRMPEAVRQ